jgi:heavy metal efflux system protein
VIHGLVDFSLKNRFIVLAATLLLIWGAISFHNLPVEAYPDVANNYVTIITQWPACRIARPCALDFAQILADGSTV